MKILIFLLFLTIPSYSQNFMSQMDVREIEQDTTIVYLNTKVIWGIKDRDMCFIWENRYLCFKKVNYASIPHRKVRGKVERYLEKHSGDRRKEKYVKVRDIFINRWEEYFLIVITMNEGIVILINRIDGDLPHYSFITVKPEKPWKYQ